MSMHVIHVKVLLALNSDLKKKKKMLSWFWIQMKKSLHKQNQAPRAIYRENAYNYKNLEEIEWLYIGKELRRKFV